MHWICSARILAKTSTFLLVCFQNSSYVHVVPMNWINTKLKYCKPVVSHMKPISIRMLHSDKQNRFIILIFIFAQKNLQVGKRIFQWAAANPCLIGCWKNNFWLQIKSGIGIYGVVLWPLGMYMSTEDCACKVESLGSNMSGSSRKQVS